MVTHVRNTVDELRRILARTERDAAAAPTPEERSELEQCAGTLRATLHELGALAVVPLLAVALALGGCVSMGPADWRPDQHVYMMRACQLLCSKAGGAHSYTITEGECTCRSK